MILRNILSFSLIINVVLIIIFNKDVFFTAKTFVIIVFLTLYYFYYRGK